METTQELNWNGEHPTNKAIAESLLAQGFINGATTLKEFYKISLAGWTPPKVWKAGISRAHKAGIIEAVKEVLLEKTREIHSLMHS